MKLWSLAPLAHFMILAAGIGFMGEGFTELSILHAPVVNLMLWTALISLAGLAASATAGKIHAWAGRLLLVIAIVWFPQ